VGPRTVLGGEEEKIFNPTRNLTPYKREYKTIPYFHNEKIEKKKFKQNLMSFSSEVCKQKQASSYLFLRIRNQGDSSF
jgi:hypothetical protein